MGDRLAVRTGREHDKGRAVVWGTDDATEGQYKGRSPVEPGPVAPMGVNFRGALPMLPAPSPSPL